MNLHRIKRLLVVNLLLLTFTQNHLLTQEVNAFVYHRFGDERYPSTNIDIERFEAQLKYIKANGYTAITVSESIELFSEKITDDRKWVALTIDDAYKSFYENALPLLKAYGIKATVFVNTETVGATDFMSWEQIEEARSAGIEIGNHSHSHDYFLNSTREAFQRDLEQSENQFLDHLGSKPLIYAYPYGEWNDEMTSILKTSGYKGAVAQNSGVMAPHSPAFALPRFPMSNAFANMEGFKEKLSIRGLDPIKQTFMANGTSDLASPHWVVQLCKKAFTKANIQGFVRGREGKLKIEDEAGLWRITLWTDHELFNRRTLFTITAQDITGQWHWLSHVYFQPEIREQ